MLNYIMNLYAFTESIVLDKVGQMPRNILDYFLVKTLGYPEIAHLFFLIKFSNTTGYFLWVDPGKKSKTGHPEVYFQNISSSLLKIREKIKTSMLAECFKIIEKAKTPVSNHRVFSEVLEWSKTMDSRTNLIIV
jgi:hypothetical protein